MSNAIIKFLRDEEGATAIEYGLIAGLISVAVVAGMGLVTGGLDVVFKRIAGVLK